MKVRVDPGRCVGHNRCLAVAPELFDVDDEGYASAVGDGTVAPGQEEDAEIAAENCPEQAVVLNPDE